MYQNCCKKCGSVSLHTEIKGNNTALYCDDCGAFQKWLGKDELRAFNYSQKENSNICADNKEMAARLKEFIEFLNKKIDSEYEKLPVSPEDTIRKNAYCLALQQDIWALENILNGKDWDYKD